ncbi:hypothetical protein FOMPIDRAFT_85445 [Fomitopsis schrenkii]|uniref:DUF6533 domain-containing protein n=1 Tax=Fomitopsis schrenkii TaxID=2126942 RepID=S8F579_FOMSC|nr:hypothetical protein FOMPIDRAFT_85445 [Fomitopsis schrenkii]
MEKAILLGTVSNYCLAAATTLYFYDTILTIADSIELIWCRKLGPASILYILSRYLTIFYLGLELLATVEKDCAYTYSRWRSAILPAPLYCTVRNTVPTAANNGLRRLTVTVRVMNIIHDGLVLLFTWLKTRGQIYDDALCLRDSLMTRLLVNGATYFVVHLVLNILDAVLTATGVFDDTVVFNAVFTPLILSHFFLSIREAHYTKEQRVSTPSQLSDLSFDRTQDPETTMTSMTLETRMVPGDEDD